MTPERHAHAGLRHRCLGNRVLPVVLAVATHHEQVARRRGEAVGTPTAAGSEQEASRPAEGDDRHEGLSLGAPDAVAVPGHRVLPVAVVVDPDRVQWTRRRSAPTVPRPWRRRSPECRGTHLAGGAEPWIIDHPVVHAAAPAGPRQTPGEIDQQRVGALQPAVRHVHPTGLVEPMPHDRGVAGGSPDRHRRAGWVGTRRAATPPWYTYICLCTRATKCPARDDLSCQPIRGT